MFYLFHSAGHLLFARKKRSSCRYLIPAICVYVAPNLHLFCAEFGFILHGVLRRIFVKFRVPKNPNINFWVGYPYLMTFFIKGVMGYLNLLNFV